MVKRLQWIDVIKFIACIGVYNAHYWGYFAYSHMGMTSFVGSGRSILDLLMNVLFNGEIGVCIFCILSGYLASEKQIDTWHYLGKNIFNRYIKFLIPLAFMTVVIVMLSAFVGFHIEKYNGVLGTQAIGLPPVINIANILKTIFLFDEVLNVPLWMFKSLFIGSCMVMCINFIFKKIDLSVNGTFFIEVSIFVLLYLAKRFVHGNFYILACCMSGMMIAPIWKSLRRFSDKLKWCLLFAWILIQTFTGAIHVFVFSYVMLCIVGGMNYNDKDSKWARTLDEASLYVYLYHDLIIGSITLWLYSILIGKLTYVQTVLSLYFITSIVLGCFVGSYMCVIRKYEQRIICFLKIG